MSYKESAIEEYSVVVYSMPLKDTEKAFAFLKDPNDTEVIWVPKSVVSHIRRYPADTNGISKCVVTAPAWLWEARGL